MGGKFPFFHLINHTEMMWSTFFFFSHRFYSMSPWRVSTANQTKSSSVQPSTTNHSQAKYEESSNRAFTVMQISVCREDQTEWTCFFFFVHFLSQVHTEFRAIYSPFDSTFNTCFLAILSSSTPLLSSHSHSPRLLLSYWSAASGIKRYLSIARLLGSINTGTSLN